MKKYIYILLTSVLALTSCNSSSSEAPAMQDSTDSTFISDGKWHEITPEEIQGNFVKFMDDGALLTAGDSTSVNTMTIGWGEIGKFWKRPVVTVYVSKSRYTYEFMEKHSMFTITMFPEEYKTNVMYMGHHSGRDGDKIKEGGLHTDFTDLGSPIFQEANLAIECRKLYQQEIDIKQAPSEIQELYQKIGPHVMYVGEIIKVWRK